MHPSEERLADPRDLLAALLDLRAAVLAEGQGLCAAWQPSLRRRAFLPGAVNLAHYLALRRRDLRPLQPALQRWGLSSLGRGESRVAPLLDTVAATLGRLCDGAVTPPHPPARRLLRGERLLAHNAAALFGPPQPGRATRIMVTLPPEAANDAAFARALLARGVECVRINCAHDTPEAWAAMLAHLRAAEREAGGDRRVRVLMDLGGPKLRTALMGDPKDQPRVRVGDRLLLARGPAQPNTALPQIGCAQPGIIEQLAVGAAVWIDDGKIGGRVAAIEADGALLEITRAPQRGKRLRPEKGLNFPDTALRVSPLTAKDRQDLDFVARHADLIGYSFVQAPADVALLLDALATGDAPARPDLGLVLKIETGRAVRQLPDLIVAAAGQMPTAVMIARGDLAVEVGFERLAEIQEELLWLCEAAHLPVIWATQVLEQLAQEGTPARGEVTDAAMGARAECVMLNKGPFILDTITFLDDVLRRMPGHQQKKTPQLRALRSWEDLFAAEPTVAAHP